MFVREESLPLTILAAVTLKTTPIATSSNIFPFVCLSLRVNSGLLVDEMVVAQPEDSWCNGGGKEGDIQIKAEECAVKNLQIRLGLTLKVRLLGQRVREREAWRWRRGGESEKEEAREREEELSEVSPDSSQLPLINRFVSDTKFKGAVFRSSCVCVFVCFCMLI